MNICITSCLFSLKHMLNGDVENLFPAVSHSLELWLFLKCIILALSHHPVLCNAVLGDHKVQRQVAATQPVVKEG